MQTEEEVQAYIRSNWTVAKEVVDKINKDIENIDIEFHEICYNFVFEMNATTRYFNSMKFHSCVVIDLDEKPSVAAIKFHKTRDNEHWSNYEKCCQCNEPTYQLVTCACRQQRRCMKCLLKFHNVNFDYDNFKFDFNKKYDELHKIKSMFAMEFLDAGNVNNLYKKNTSFIRLKRKLLDDWKYFLRFDKTREEFPFLNEKNYNMFRIYVADIDHIATLLYCFEKKGVKTLLY